MSYFCPGKRECGMYCRQKVTKLGEYCRHHLHQKPQVALCNCYLESGSTCPYPSGPNGFCEYHIEPTKCQGNTLMGGQCLRAIPSGKYCSRCKCTAMSVEDGVKSKAGQMRAVMVEKHGPIVVEKKHATFVPLISTAHSSITASSLKIPKDLKKIEIAKPDDCCICQDPMVIEDRTSYRQLHCGHWFHLDCISKIMKMECPMCRTSIRESSLPKWAISRIKENMDRGEHDKIREIEEAGRRMAQEMAAENILDMIDMDSQDEEDLAVRLQNGARVGVGPVVDEHGRMRVAVVVYGGTSP